MQVAPPPPPPLEHLPAGYQLRAGLGVATVLADFDFETYSPAGFVWNEATGKYDRPAGTPPSKKKGLGSVGAAVYAEHPDTEILSLYYDLKDGTGRHHWRPGMPPPQSLLDHVAAGRLIEAHNSSFEHWIWNHVAVPRHGWPPLDIAQLRCSMAKARASALPGALEKLGEVLHLNVQKDRAGDNLLKLFSVPRAPTAKDPRRRVLPSEDPVQAQALYSYNETDIVTEAEASSRVPDLSPAETAFWICDQRINYRGVQVDRVSVDACIVILEQAFEVYNAELERLTDGAVPGASKLQALAKWLREQGLPVRTGKGSTDEEAFDSLLEWVDTQLRDPFESEQVVQRLRKARRAIEIRQLVGSASVKKVYALRNMSTRASRLHDLFVYHAARTGRAGGRDAQPQNMPKAGPDVARCQCGKWHGSITICPWCGAIATPRKGWNPDAVEDVLTIMRLGSLKMVEFFFGDALLCISGVLRGMFIARDGYDLISSDYSAIEGVVAAMLTGCQWRIDVFRTHGKIYELSVAKITGTPFSEIMAHAGFDTTLPEWWTKKKPGSWSHHPLRQGIGKVAELASGFGGWVGSWKAFGAEDHFPHDDAIVQAIKAWRNASPEFPEMWGGQWRGTPWDGRKELYGLEGMFIAAILEPGVWKTYRDISYIKHGDAVYCRLPSGRLLTYHSPRLSPGGRNGTLKITYMGWNTNPKMGRIGWVVLDTYGGRLFENVVQAVARDILSHAIVNLERAGYPVVLHIHDEVVAEVPKDFGSVQEFEGILAIMDDWAKGWPIRAAGGYRERRYKKD